MTMLETLPRPASDVDWGDGRWLNAPFASEVDGPDLVVRARHGSDFWRASAIGAGCHDGHALLQPFAPGDSIDVSFRLDFHHRLDQAGILVRDSPNHWVKAGVEICDGVAHVGAVVTRGASDWSMTSVPSWRDSLVTIRAIWTRESLVLCARSSQSGWRTLRVAPWDADAVEAGPFCAAPDRGDLSVRFTSWQFGSAEVRPHARLANRG